MRLIIWLFLMLKTIDIICVQMKNKGNIYGFTEKLCPIKNERES